MEKWFQTAGKPWHGRVAPRHVFCPVWVMVWGNCKFCKIALFLRKPLDAKAEKPSDFIEIRRFCDCGHDLNLRPPGYKLLSFSLSAAPQRFPDFCGTWNRPKPVIHFFLLHDGFQQSVASHGAGKDAEIRSTRNASNGLCLHIGGDVLTPHCMNQTERALGLCSSDVLPDQYPIAAFGKMTISSGKSIIKKQATRKIITYGMTALYITLVSTPGGATPCK